MLSSSSINSGYGTQYCPCMIRKVRTFETINLCPAFSVDAQLGGFVLLECLVGTVTTSQKLHVETVYASQVRAN